MSVNYSVRFGLGLRISEDDVGMDRLDDLVSPSNLPDGFEAYMGGDKMDGEDIAVLIARPEHVVVLQTTLDPIGDRFGVLKPSDLVEYDKFAGKSLETLLEFAYDNDVVPHLGYFVVSEVG